MTRTIFQTTFCGVMLQLRSIFHCGSTLELINGENLALSHKRDFDKVVETHEAFSGNHICSNVFECELMDSNTIEQIIEVEDLIVGIDLSRGILFVQDIHMCIEYTKRIQLKLKPGAKIISCCGKDGIFFYLCSDELVLRCISLCKESFGNEIFSNRIDKGFDKWQSSTIVLSMHCHNLKPQLFIVTNDSVQIWNYSNLKKKLSNGDPQQQDDQDEGDDGGSDTASVASAAFASPKPSKQKLAMIVPRAITLAPFAKDKSNITFAHLDPMGRFLAVVWNYEVVALYDVRDISNNLTGIAVINHMNCCSALPGDQHIVAAAVHPFEPFVVLCIEHSETARDQNIRRQRVSIAVMSFWGIRLRQLGQQDISNAVQTVSTEQLVHFLKITEQSGLIILAVSPGHSTSGCLTESRQWSTGKTALCFSFCPSWLSWHSIAKPVMNRLSINSDAYLDGDSVIMRDHTGKVDPAIPVGIVSKHAWPLLLATKSIPDMKDKPTASDNNSKLYSATHHLFRIGMSFGMAVVAPPSDDTPAGNTSAVDKTQVYVGAIPLATNKRTDPAWIELHPDDCSVMQGPFTPAVIKVNELALQGNGSICELALCADGQSIDPRSVCPWDAILVGSVIVPNDNICPHSYEFKRVVCLVRQVPIGSWPVAESGPPVDYSGHVLKTLFTSFRDAIFWTECGSLVKPSSSNCSWSLLGLSSSGMSVKHYKYTPNNLQTLKETKSWQMTQPMMSLWPANIGQPNVFLLVSAVTATNRNQCIFASAPGSLELDSNSYSLYASELVTDVLWMPSSSSQSTDIPEKIMRDRVWAAFGPLIGVLTNHRVILLNSQLRAVNQIVHSPFTHGNDIIGNSRDCDAVSSICWVGGALLFARSSGAVDYLTIPHANRTHGDCNNMPINFQLSLARLQSSRAQAQSAGTGRVCSLPRGLTMAGSMRLMACMPDRLMLACVVPMTSSTTIQNNISSMSLSLTTRPVIPVEPLIASLIATPVAVIDAVFSVEFHKMRIEMLQLLIAHYIRPIRPAKVGNDEVAVIATQSSGHLVSMLAAAGFDEIAAIISGLTKGPGAQDAAATMPTCRWLSNSQKFDVGMRAGNYKTACVNLLANRLDLVELYLDPESFGGGVLPDCRSSFSVQLSSAALVLAACGQSNSAKLFLDLSGNDCKLAQHLAQSKGFSSTSSDSLPSELTALQSALTTCNPELKHLISQKYDKNLGGTKFVTDIVSIHSIGGFHRRSSMLRIPLLKEIERPVPNINCNPSSSEKQATPRLTCPNLNNNQLGPTSSLGNLAKDSIDEWLGLRQRLEQSSTALHSHASKVGLKATQGGHDAGPILPDGLTNPPETWVTGVGQGKEFDKVAGYWRFSDCIFAGEKEFTSFASPGNRLSITDLSKYGSNLELYCATPDSVVIEPTTSNVDPGEDHEKVKTLCDVVIKESCSSGLRALIGRGGPLDVGMLHNDLERSRLTVEIMVFANPLRKLSQPIQLCQRTIGICGNPSDARVKLWSLCIEVDGTVSWLFNGRLVVKTKESINCLQVVQGQSAAPGVGLGEWVHVAASVESKGPSCVVSLYVNGELTKKQQASANLIGMNITEEDVALTTLFVGADLPVGWRLTECRLWADCRTNQEIDDQRDNYLSLASKRKRQQFGIKGAKETFVPFRSIQIGSPSEVVIMPDLKPKEQSGAAKKDGTEKPTVVPRPMFLPARLGAPELSGDKISAEASGGGAGTSNIGLLRSSGVSKVGLGGLPSLGLAPAARTGELSAAARARRLATASTAGLPLTRPAGLTLGRSGGAGVGGGASASASATDGTATVAVSTASISSSTANATLLWSAIDMGIKPDDLFWSANKSNILHSSRFVPVPRASELGISTTEFDQLELKNANFDNRLWRWKHTSTPPAPIESVLVCPFPNNNRKILCIYANKTLVVCECPATGATATTEERRTVQKLTEQPMGVPLVYWAFISCDELRLVSPTAVFGWKIFGQGSLVFLKPQKLFERNDLEDPKRWQDRRVVDLRVSGPWHILLTCPRLPASSGPLSPARDSVLQGSKVSVFNAITGQAMWCLGVAACFHRTPSVDTTERLAVVHLPTAAQASTEGHSQRLSIAHVSVVCTQPLKPGAPPPASGCLDLSTGIQGNRLDWVQQVTTQDLDVSLGQLSPAIALSSSSLASVCWGGWLTATPLGKLVYVNHNCLMASSQGSAASAVCIILHPAVASSHDNSTAFAVEDCAVVQTLDDDLFACFNTPSQHMGAAVAACDVSIIVLTSSGRILEISK